MFEVLRLIVANEGGVLALYRGFGPTLFKAAMTEAILSAVRDQVS